MRVLKPGVDVIVINYQCPDDLQGFLDSLDPQLDHDVWIGNVCPTSTDEGIANDYVLAHENATVWHWGENVGYGKAVNFLAALGEREVLAIFNADVRVSPLSIERCSSALRDCPDWGVLGPCQVNENGRVTAGGIFGTNAKPADRGWMSHAPAQYGDVRDDAISVSGSAYFAQRSVWEELARCDHNAGAFLPTPLYYEETWCSYHARAHGYKVVYWGQVVMTHHHHRAIDKRGEMWANQQRKVSQQMFRDACAAHNIECE